MKATCHLGSAVNLLFGCLANTTSFYETDDKKYLTWKNQSGFSGRLCSSCHLTNLEMHTLVGECTVLVNSIVHTMIIKEGDDERMAI